MVDDKWILCLDNTSSKMSNNALKSLLFNLYKAKCCSGPILSATTPRRHCHKLLILLWFKTLVNGIIRDWLMWQHVFSCSVYISLLWPTIGQKDWCYKEKTCCQNVFASLDCRIVCECSEPTSSYCKDFKWDSRFILY